jgi:hypothetical protein
LYNEYRIRWKLSFMNIVRNLIIIPVIGCMFLLSCKKSNQAPPDTRKVKFQLYTTDNFSTSTERIDFSVFISAGNTTLWDSALAPMNIKDIPGPGNKLVIEKQVPGNNSGDLVVGFRYTIENVGNSWYQDTSKAGSTLKILDYNFH